MGVSEKVVETRGVASFRLTPTTLPEETFGASYVWPPQARACGRQASDSSPSDQDRTRVDVVIHVPLKDLSAQRKGPDTATTVCQDLGNPSNETPRTYLATGATE